jgi:hypothetical protein
MQQALRFVRLHSAIAAALLAVLALAVAGYTQNAAPAQPRVARPAEANNYVAPALCEKCHTEIARNFRKTGMARSFYRLNPRNLVEDFTRGWRQPSSSSSW